MNNLCYCLPITSNKLLFLLDVEQEIIIDQTSCQMDGKKGDSESIDKKWSPAFPENRRLHSIDTHKRTSQRLDHCYYYSLGRIPFWRMIHHFSGTWPVNFGVSGEGLRDLAGKVWGLRRGTGLWLEGSGVERIMWWKKDVPANI